MLLTVGIPTYTRSFYLREMIWSVVEQIEENDLQDLVEIVVGDNCSTDDTAMMVNGLINSGKTYIRYFQNEANLGSVKNLLRTLEHARGKYYMFYGDDDLMCRGSLIKILSLLKEYSSIPVFVFRQKGYDGIKESKLISTHECAASYFYYMGNACSAVETASAKRNLASMYDVITSTCWPQTHLMYLSMYDSGLEKTTMASTLEVYETQEKNNNNIPNAFYYYDSQFYALLRLAKIISEQKDKKFYSKVKTGIPTLSLKQYPGFLVYVTNLNKFYSIGNEKHDYEVTLKESFRNIRGSYKLYVFPFMILNALPTGFYRFLYVNARTVYSFFRNRNGRTFRQINRQIRMEIEERKNVKRESAKQKHSITVNRGEW